MWAKYPTPPHVHSGSLMPPDLAPSKYLHRSPISGTLPTRNSEPWPTWHLQAEPSTGLSSSSVVQEEGTGNPALHGRLFGRRLNAVLVECSCELINKSKEHRGQGGGLADKSEARPKQRGDL